MPSRSGNKEREKPRGGADAASERPGRGERSERAELEDAVRGEAGTAPDEPTAGMVDLFRRALTLGLSGIFTTEQAFRRALGDTLPRDWVDFAVLQSERTRDEFVGRLATEVASVLETMNLDEVIQRTLADHRIEVTAEIRLVPDEDRGSGKPGQTAQVKVVRGGRRR